MILKINVIDFINFKDRYQSFYRILIKISSVPNMTCDPPYLLFKSILISQITLLKVGIIYFVYLFV